MCSWSEPAAVAIAPLVTCGQDGRKAKNDICPLTEKMHRSTRGWRQLEGDAGRLQIGRNVTTRYRGGDPRGRIVWKWRAEAHFEISHMLRFSSWETFLCSSWLCALQALILEFMTTEEQGQLAQLVFLRLRKKKNVKEKTAKVSHRVQPSKLLFFSPDYTSGAEYHNGLSKRAHFALLNPQCVFNITQIHWNPLTTVLLLQNISSEILLSN